MKKFILILYPVVLIISLVGCNTEEVVCPDSNIPDLTFSLTNASKTAIDSVIIFSPGLPDSIFKFNGSALPLSFDLPINLNSDTTQVVFKYRYTKTQIISRKPTETNGTSQLATDTLWMIYEKNIKLNDLECGFITEFYLKEIKRSVQLIDSIAKVDTLITTTPGTHVEIYY